MDTTPYVIGGPGSISNETAQRRAAKLSVTQRIKAGGSHEIKAGIEPRTTSRHQPPVLGRRVHPELRRLRQRPRHPLVQLLARSARPR